MKKCSLWVLAFVAFVVASSNGGGGGSRKRKRAKALRRKAESVPEMEVHRLQKADRKIELNAKYAQLIDVHARFEDSEDAAVQDEDELDREVEAVFDGVEMVEEDEVDSQNTMLATAVRTMQDSVKFYLGNVLQYGEDDYDDDDYDDDATSADVKLSDEQLDMIAEKISERLNREVKQEFKAKADGVREEKMNEIHNVVTEDRIANMNARAIQRDVHEAESVVLGDLRDEINDAAKRAKDDIPNKMLKIRSEVVEEVTGKKLDALIKRKEMRQARVKEMIKTFNEMKAKTGDKGNAATLITKGGGKWSAEATQFVEKGLKLKGMEGGKESGQKFDKMPAKASGNTKPEATKSEPAGDGDAGDGAGYGDRDDPSDNESKASVKESGPSGGDGIRSGESDRDDGPEDDSKAKSKPGDRSEEDPSKAGPSAEESSGSGENDEEKDDNEGGGNDDGEGGDGDGSKN